MGDPQQTPVELELVIRVRYLAYPNHYGTDDPAKMAAIDVDNLESDPEGLFEIISAADIGMMKVEVLIPGA